LLRSDCAPRATQSIAQGCFFFSQLLCTLWEYYPSKNSYKARDSYKKNPPTGIKSRALMACLCSFTKLRYQQVERLFLRQNCSNANFLTHVVTNRETKYENGHYFCQVQINRCQNNAEK